MADKTLTAACHCRATQFILTLNAAILPLDAQLCHCSVCRTTQGAPCSFYARIPSGIEPLFIAPSSLSKLTGYNHPNANSTRYFCNTCGCHVGGKDRKGQWYISVSIFEEGDWEAWVIASHAYTNTTRDGGLSGL